MAIPHGRIILAIASFGSIIQLSCGPRELSFQGRTAEQWVKLLGTSKSGTDNPLNIRQVITGEESNRITFEVAISYDLLQDNPKEKRLGKLALYIDGNDECLAQRATNGNCLLTWDKTYTAPGMHEAYAQLTISGRSGTRPLVIKGPVRSVSSSN